MFFILTCQEVSNVHIYSQMLVSALAKKWLFWFCEALACVSGKTKCATCAAGKIVFEKCGSAKKIKHEAMGCRFGKNSAVKFICRPVVSIISVSLMVVVSVFTLAYNVLRLGVVADF
jgi:hypothetical protein